MKKTLMIVLTAVLLLIAADLDVTETILGKLRSAFYPAFVGVLVALFLNAPVKFLENGLLSSPKLARFRRALSLGITVTGVGGVLAGIIALTSSQIGDSVAGLTEALESLKNNASDSRIVDTLIVEGGKILKEKLPDLTSLALSGVKEAVSLFLGVALGVMLVASKESVAGMLHAVADRILGAERGALFRGALSAAADKFSKFLGGQALEALIFGAVCYVCFLLLKIPYPMLIALIVALTNLIPTLGGYIGGVLGAVAVLAAAPDKVLIFAAAILVLQQLEQITTYPVIVGRYVGLKSFYVMLAVVAGGGLMGFWGLILGVPMAAFAYNLLEVLLRRKSATATDADCDTREAASEKKRTTDLQNRS